MSAPDDIIRRIQDKLQLVMRQLLALRKENEKLKAELQETKVAVGERDELIQILELRISVLKAAKGEMPAEDRKQLEKKISLYIKEVDKCLAYLKD